MATASEKGKAKDQQVARNEPAQTGSSALAQQRSGPVASHSGWEPVRRMRDEFDRLFDQFIRGWSAPGVGRDRYWGLDVRETDDRVEVRAEAPGFEAGDFDLQVRGGQLVLHAAHKGESGDEDRGYHEWHQQEYYQAVPMPAGVDANKVEAHYRNGVLSVTVPKTEDSKPRRISVQG